MAAATRRMTNKEFGQRVGCHHSMASRIRAGLRAPGVELMSRIGKEFGISEKSLMKAREAGPAEFAALLEKKEPKVPAA